MVRLITIVNTLALAVAAVHAAPHLTARQLPDPAIKDKKGSDPKLIGKQLINGECVNSLNCQSGCCATLPRGGQTIGVCSGPGAQFQAGKQGCGFGDGLDAIIPIDDDGASDDPSDGLLEVIPIEDEEAIATAPAPAPVNTAAPAANAGPPLDNTDLPEPPTSIPVPVNPPVGLPIVVTNLRPDPVSNKNAGNLAGEQFITGRCFEDRDCGSGCCAVVNSGDGLYFGICSGPAVNFANGKQGCGFPFGGGAGIGSQTP